MSEATGQAVIDEVIDQVAPPRDADEQSEIEEAAKRAGTVQMIAVADIVKSEVSLRDVQRQTEGFQLLVNSIRKKGVLNSILVRKIIIPGGVVRYGLIDGLQRFTAAGDAGLTHIPARVVEMDDAEILEAQIITNMNRVQTRPADLSKHLLRIMSRNPFMTVDQMAEKVCQSRTWVEQRLSLNKLKPEIQELVNEGKIHLTNAYALSKIPDTEQVEHVQAAITESPKTFVPRMKERVKAIKDAKHSGRDAGKAEFQPVMHMQKVGDVKAEFEALSSGEGESKLRLLLAKHGVTDPLEAAKLAVAWTLHFDPDSQVEQKEKHELKEKQRKEQEARRREERAKKKEQEAVETAADVTAGF